MSKCSEIKQCIFAAGASDDDAQISPHKECDLRLAEMKKDLLENSDIKIRTWFQAMDLFDRKITEHTLRVTALSLELGRMLGLNTERLIDIQFGTLLHDIGKLGIPDEIIQKPGSLTPEEYQVVQKHPVYAYEWIAHWGDIQPSYVIPLYHHERWDGTGYPHQLKGQEIPLLARVVAVADVWDAVTSDRPYRRAIDKDKAIEIIQSESGHHFDPELVSVFMNSGTHADRVIPYSEALIL